MGDGAMRAVEAGVGQHLKALFTGAVGPSTVPKVSCVTLAAGGDRAEMIVTVELLRPGGGGGGGGSSSSGGGGGSASATGGGGDGSGDAREIAFNLNVERWNTRPCVRRRKDFIPAGSFASTFTFTPRSGIPKVYRVVDIHPMALKRPLIAMEAGPRRWDDLLRAPDVSRYLFSASVLRT